MPSVALVRAQAGMRPKSGLYRGADALIAEIDEMALILTGDRTHFYTSGHAEQMRKAPVRKKEA